jgi:hypothetical protein
MNSIGKNDGSAMWMFYHSARSQWIKEKFAKEFPGEKDYRHSLREEVEALGVVATIISESVKNEKMKEKDLEPSIANLLKVHNAGLTTGKYRVTNTIAAIDVDPTYNNNTMTLTNVFNKILNGQIGPQIDGLASGANRSIQGSPGTSTNGRTNPVSSLYGQPSGYQDARNIRFGLRFTF